MEVRWFYRGAVPQQLLDWFQQGRPSPQKQPARVDDYLQLTDGSDGLGIKLREGRLELKQRYFQRQAVRLHDQVVGVVELWRKWGFEVTEADQPAGPDPAWLGVKKERQLRKYQRTGATVTPVSVEAEVEQGCNLELVIISVDGQDWWSLCFEAFGPEASLQESLLLATRHAFASGSPPVLEAEASYSYPRWLQLVRAEG
jgi:hypothetical protein